MRVTLASLALLTAFAAPIAAHASPLFDLFTSTYGSRTITFELPSNSVPIGYLEDNSLGGQYFGGVISEPAFTPYRMERSVGMPNIATMPEPSPLILLGSGLLFVAGALRWRS